jgi:transposase
LQTSDALGAAAAQLGPDAQAAVVEFNKQAGMSHGKISRVFQTLFGIRLSRGGSVHVVLRAARRCEPVYKNICETIKASPWTVLDETGWHVGGKNAWLHGLVGPDATAYVIDPTRSGAIAGRVLGRDYNGIMIHDGWSPYDNFVNAEHQQCLGHLLRRCHELLETATRGAVCFPRRVNELLHHALDLRDRHADGELSDHGLAVCRGRLHHELLDAIYPPKSNAANETFAQHLWNHRDDLLTFLKHPGVDATNWRGELAMRFGVILRKVWGGNRTWTGARAQAVLMSVWRTCWQRGQNAVNFLSHLLRRCRPALVGLPP